MALPRICRSWRGFVLPVRLGTPLLLLTPLAMTCPSLGTGAGPTGETEPLRCRARHEPLAIRPAHLERAPPARTRLSRRCWADCLQTWSQGLSGHPRVRATTLGHDGCISDGPVIQSRGKEVLRPVQGGSRAPSTGDQPSYDMLRPPQICPLQACTSPAGRLLRTQATT